jgi:hypothetical protein
MFDERAQVARRWIGNPDEGEAVVLQEVAEVPGVPPIRLGFAHDHRPDLGGLADEERMAQATTRRRSVRRRRPCGTAPGPGSPVSVLSRATCCLRVCKSHPTRIMSSASICVASGYSARPRLPATSGCSHDISEPQGREVTPTAGQGHGPRSVRPARGRRRELGLMQKWLDSWSGIGLVRRRHVGHALHGELGRARRRPLDRRVLPRAWRPSNHAPCRCSRRHGAQRLACGVAAGCLAAGIGIL